MIRLSLTLAVCLSWLALSAPAPVGGPGELRVGVAGHAFDHLGSIGDQAKEILLHRRGLGRDRESAAVAWLKAKGSELVSRWV